MLALVSYAIRLKWSKVAPGRFPFLPVKLVWYVTFKEPVAVLFDRLQAGSQCGTNDLIVRQSIVLVKGRAMGRKLVNQKNRYKTIYWLIKWRTERDSNPRYAFTYTRVPGVRLKPLGHLSVRSGASFGRSGRSGAIYNEDFPAINRNLTVF